MLTLPGILDEIAEVAGLKAALQVARARGGTKAYFGERPTGDNWLVKAVGQETALIIGKHFSSGCGGLDLEVPLGPAADRVRIWRQIRIRHAQGQTKRQISLALGITGRTVQYHINGHRPIADAEFELAMSDGDVEGTEMAGTTAGLADAVAENAAVAARLLAENEALRRELDQLRRAYGERAEGNHAKPPVQRAA